MVNARVISAIKDTLIGLVIMGIMLLLGGLKAKRFVGFTYVILICIEKHELGAAVYWSLLLLLAFCLVISGPIRIIQIIRKGNKDTHKELTHYGNN